MTKEVSQDQQIAQYLYNLLEQNTNAPIAQRNNVTVGMNWLAQVIQGQRIVTEVDPSAATPDLALVPDTAETKPDA